MLVGPGVHVITVIDPGVFNQGTYDGVFRWRLTHQPIGRFGFGLAVVGACPFTCPGTYGFDFLGEVEDYILEDAQLSVELNNFDAIAEDSRVTLNWTTASETNNDHFDITRDGALMGMVSTAGNGASGHSYSWTENNLTNGTEYTYTVSAVDVNGVSEELFTISATPMTAATITEYALHQNFPNPFNPGTSITFDLVDNGFVSLRVYNLLGQEVASLVNGTMDAGRHIVNFQADNLPSGLYLYRLETNGFSAQKKMVLMK
jgi:hypothetical protein